MTACLTSASHGPASAMGVCSKCGEWLRTARGVQVWRFVTRSRPIAGDMDALRLHFASVRPIGGGRVRTKEKRAR
jgi:hypothetical protein